MQPAVLLLLVQIALPPLRGYVNDFAGVLDPASVSHIEAVIAEVREKSRREFGSTLAGDPPPPPDETDRLPIPGGLVIAVVVLLIIVTRGRILWWIFVFSRFGGRGRGWSGGGGGGWGGGGGFSGGFGGFGGGGWLFGGGAGGGFRALRRFRGVSLWTTVGTALVAD